VFRGKYAVVEYGESKIDSAAEFWIRLQQKLPVGTKLFCGKKLKAGLYGEDGKECLFYCVVMMFPYSVCWTCVRQYFEFDDSTQGRIMQIWSDQSVYGRHILSNVEGFVEDGSEEVFGERFWVKKRRFDGICV
jgi:hypothetical protein